MAVHSTCLGLTTGEPNYVILQNNHMNEKIMATSQ